ncbi:MAG: RsmE family RNA methyltransferase [Firmicutes bacterium]|nr:RsmE family RNA methyltransferase [Bacillota bacterium]MDY5335959.1 RsmE family RNA methyltransferase [Bacilli bacterium]
MQRYFIKNKDMLLEESDIRHIKKVMRMNINDKIEVVYNNKLHICKITSLEPFNIKVIEKLDEDKKTKIELTVAVALVKEQKMDLILQKLTELGVSRIIPVSMERSIVKLDKERFNKKKVRWESICKEASEQSKRTNIPIIEDIKSIKDLTKEDADLKLVASTKEKEKLLNYYLQSIEDCAKIIMVIGPEGGISDKEEDILVSNGYNRVSFGNLIFRVETATIYVASIINYISSRS